MIDAIQIAASGLRSGQKQIDTISNNVANMQTPGFKRSRVNFADIAAPTPALDPSLPPLAADQLAAGGTRVASTTPIFDQGEMRLTGNPLDVAVDGNGFYEFEALDGSLVYSRNGQFRIDEEGVLRNNQGLRLSASIQVPHEATDLQIAANGEVSVKLPGQTERSLVGQIELTTFAAPDAMRGTGDNLFAATEQAGAPQYGRPGDAAFGSLRQGQMEMANVQIIEEMSSLVLAQRAYQLNARVLQAADQVLETINNLRR